jgi:hypothetical protein
MAASASLHPALSLDEWKQSARYLEELDRRGGSDPRTDELRRRTIAMCNMALPVGEKWTHADVRDLRRAGLNSLADRLACFLPPES